MNASVPFWSGTCLHLTVPVTQRSKALLPCRTGLGFWIHWGLAAALSTALLCFLSWLNTGAFDAHYRTLALVAVLVAAILVALVSVPLYRRFRVYLNSPQLISGREPLAAAWLSLMACLAAIALLTNTADTFSPEVLISWAILGFVLQAGGCIPLQNLARRYFRQPHRGQILGSGIGSATVSAGLVGINNAALLLDIKRLIKTPFRLLGKDVY